MNEITILHVEGCTGAVEARVVASEVAAARTDVTVIEVLVEVEDQALARGLRGSPSVLVNGKDVDADTPIPLGSMS